MNPSPCRVLGVFGLSLQTDERDVRRVFEKYGRLDKVKLVTDPRVSLIVNRQLERERERNKIFILNQTNKSRGFAFIYFDKVNDAQDAKENLHGYEVDGHHIRVEYSISNKEHNPTPGVYMGRSYRDSYRGGGGGRYDDRRDYDYGRRGSSRRYSSRSRSRSYESKSWVGGVSYLILKLYLKKDDEEAIQETDKSNKNVSFFSLTFSFLFFG